MRWVARQAGEVVGVATATHRPDSRQFVAFARSAPSSLAALAGAAAAKLPSARIHTMVAANDAETVRALRAAGFDVEVVVERFRIAFARALAALRRAWVPEGFHLAHVDEVDEAQALELDNLLRRDVPGTDGWQGTLRMWRDELSESPPFDRSGYLVAVERVSGEPAGLIRFWRNPEGPRLGLLGVTRRHRGGPLAAGLLKSGLQAAADWGHETFVTETSPSNRVPYNAMARVGAQSQGRLLQLVRPG